MYSNKTMCPQCKGKIALESVALTACFQCPICHARVSVSPAYRRTQLWVVSILSAALLFLLGARWLILVFWLPMLMLLAAVYAYTVKYFLAPKLVHYVPVTPVTGRISLNISENSNLEKSEDIHDG